MGPAPSWRRRTRSLPVRLIALMTLALLPLGLISLYQTRSVIDRAEDLAKVSQLHVPWPGFPEDLG